MPDDAQDKLLLVEQDIFERDLILDELRRIFQLATTDKIQFLSRASDLTNHQRKFDKVQSKIEKTLIKAKLFEKEDHIKMRNDFSDLYYAIISHVNSYKSADEQNRRLSRACNAHEVTNHRNLPILPLPEFNGDPTNWPSFFDLFCSLIHNNNAYTKTEKLRYLLLSVKNEPYDLIKSIPITEENYLLALTTLKSRYENRRIIASKHLDRILDLEICSDRVGQSVRNLLNIYQENIRALEAMDFPVNEWSFIILNILLRKISPGLRKNYERSLSRPSEIPHISTLIEFLEREISAEEITNSTISNKQPIKNYYSNSPTTRKQIGGKPSRAYVSSMAAVASRSRPSSPRNKDRFCLKCSGQHTLPKCSEFLNLSPQDRHTFVKNKSICWNCLNVGHDLKNCKSNFVCRVCHKRHHSLLHLNLSQSFPAVNDTENNIGVSLPLTEGERKDDAIHNNCATNFQSTRSMDTVLLSTAVIDIYFNNNKISTVRCIVDSGSQASFITEACVQRLGLPRRQINIPIFGIGDTVPLQPKGMVTCAITPRNKQQPFIPVDALILPSLMSKIPSVSLPFSEWPHIRGLSLADPDFHKSQPVDMLLGADILSQILLNNTIAGPPGTPIAIDSVFGYLLCGKLTCNVSVSTPLQVCFSSFDNDNLQRFWELESVSEERSYTPDEEYCESFFQQTYTRDHTGRYIVALPFKVNAPPLGESRQIAVARFNKLEYRLEHNPQLKVDYHSCLQEYLDLEHMEPCVDRPLSGASYYIPHHCVIKPTSETTRTRVVFDAGCRSTSGFSLNDLLLSGPKLHLDIVDVLLKFRVHAVALCCDIRQMYRNILVREEDRNFQRLLWRRSPEEPLRDYRLRTVTFGINCSPYLALRTIRQLAYDEADRFPLASSVLLNDVFVDDVVSGSNTQANALALQQELIGICDAAGFSLRKWQSNEPALLAAVQPPDLHGGRQENVPFAEMENDTGVKVLGLQWNPKSDCFNFKVQVTSHKCTKRTILSEVAKIYDPLGLLAPVILFAKHLIQLLWSANISWDEQPPTNVVHSWTCFTNELSLLSQAKFSRYIFDTNDINSIQIHGFADASQIGYGACVYIRHSGRNGEIKTYLIVAKTRVAPLRTPLTIPRLELLAALLLSKLLERVIHIYGDRINVDQLYAWSDSSIVLAWLRSSPHEWKTFVSNRVSSIISRVPAESWHHVPSADNAADPASRGLLPGALIRDEQWFCGPAWLRLDASSWPIQGHNVDTNEERVRKDISQSSFNIVHSCTVSSSSITDFDNFISRYSSLEKLVRITCYIFRFYYKCKRRSQSFPNYITVPEYNFSLNRLIFVTQQSVFKDDISNILQNKLVSVSLRRLTPYMDSDGFLRVGGRIHKSLLPFNAKHQLILPKRHHLTNLIIDNTHVTDLHAGPQSVRHSLLQRYWILSSRDIVRQRIHRCIRCFRVRPTRMQPRMGSLPVSRLRPTRVFQKTSVDFAGPFYLRTSTLRNAKIVKCYVAVFVCMSVKAVHLEMVSELSTDAFLAALRRFISRRGYCTDIYSDCGRNFVGCDNYLKDLFKFISSDPVQSVLNQQTLKQGITWHFQPPYASHFGGLFEASVKSFKYHLQRVVGTRVQTYEEMHTLTCQIEAVLNSRPLCALSSDASDPLPLTPAHFLIGEPITALPDVSLVDENPSRLTRWRWIQQSLQHFWKRWSKEYLHELQQSGKWFQDRGPMLREGTIVVVCDEQLPPLQWKLARVHALHPGSDQVTRVVTLKLGNTLIKRPVVKICPLPLE